MSALGAKQAHSVRTAASSRSRPTAATGRGGVTRRCAGVGAAPTRQRDRGRPASQGEHEVSPWRVRSCPARSAGDCGRELSRRDLPCAPSDHAALRWGDGRVAHERRRLGLVGIDVRGHGRFLGLRALWRLLAGAERELHRPREHGAARTDGIPAAGPRAQARQPARSPSTSTTLCAPSSTTTRGRRPRPSRRVAEAVSVARRQADHTR
jgi:hypothetical protein